MGIPSSTLYRDKPLKDFSASYGSAPYFRYGGNKVTGWRKSKEDRFVCHANFFNDFSFFGVYDGHGGEEVAEYLKQNLHLDVLNTLKGLEDPEVALYLGFLISDFTLRNLTEKELVDVENVTLKRFKFQDPSTIASKPEFKETVISEINKVFQEKVIERKSQASSACDPVKPLIRSLIASSQTMQNLYSEHIEDDEEDEDHDYSLDEIVLSGEESSSSSEIDEEMEISDENDVSDYSLLDTPSEKDIEEADCDDADCDDYNTAKESIMTNEAELEEDNNVSKEEKMTEESKDSAISDKDDDIKNVPEEKIDEADCEDHNAAKESIMNNKEELDEDKMKNLSKEEKLTEESQDSAISDKDKDSKIGLPDESTAKEILSDDPAFDQKSETISPGKSSVSNEENSTKPLVGSLCGSTATVLLLNKDKAYVASVGDSRCVACIKGTAVDLSKDHIPTDTNEYHRIKKSGHEVEDERIDGGLNMSRAFGDFHLKKNNSQEPTDALICHPEISVLEINKDLEFIIIASDGIWHALSSQDVVNFVKDRRGDDPVDICTELFELILPEKLTDDGSGCDNMSAIIIFFEETKISGYIDKTEKVRYVFKKKLNQTNEINKINTEENFERGNESSSDLEIVYESPFKSNDTPVIKYNCNVIPNVESTSYEDNIICDDADVVFDNDVVKNYENDNVMKFLHEINKINTNMKFRRYDESGDKEIVYDDGVHEVSDSGSQLEAAEIQEIEEIYDGLSDDKLSDDKLSDDKLSDDKLSGDKLSGDKLSGDKLSDDKLSGDKLSGDKLSGDKLSDDKILDDEKVPPVVSDAMDLTKSG